MTARDNHPSNAPEAVTEWRAKNQGIEAVEPFSTRRSWRSSLTPSNEEGENASG
jgi:hypothetical protein